MTVASGSQILASDHLKHNNANGELEMAASTELTIATGAITPTQNFHRVDTEADAASDDLDTITLPSDATDGYLLFLRAENDGRTVVVKHNTGNIMCFGNADITLDDSHDWAVAIYDSNLTKWMALGAEVADNAISNAKLRNSGALSVIGRSANSTGDPADISATAASGAVLRESGSVLGFGTVATAGLAANSVDDTIAGNRVPQFYRRQGGSTTIWSTAGTTTYTPTAVRMQAGVITVTGGAITMTFPTAFSQAPILILTPFSGGGDDTAVVKAIAADTADIESRRAGVITAMDVCWLAIGPE